VASPRVRARGWRCSPRRWRGRCGRRRPRRRSGCRINLSGQISTLGVWLAKAGGFFAFLSPVVGWFGVTITGTDAGSNALFGNLQVTAAHQLNVSPALFGAANTSGGVMAKMISPQNLAVGTAAVGIVGAEGTLFRRVFGWSALLLLLMCLLV
jgi:lactate permease